MLHDAHRSSERVGTRFWFSSGRAVSASWPSWPRALTPATVSRHRQPRGRYGVVLDRACARSATRLWLVQAPDAGSAWRTTNTGQGARWTTFSATLPNSTCIRPVRPCVPMTMRSTWRALATSTIS